MRGPGCLFGHCSSKCCNLNITILILDRLTGCLDVRVQARLLVGLWSFLCVTLQSRAWAFKCGHLCYYFGNVQTVVFMLVSRNFTS
ncbi:hypothetical protein LZ32DRAFT_169090 [Colletotrichum eremochloae]|nr:hypothetical protein LZ32DRAFT_169090 [Colletotrichum eremochloae]